MENFVYNDGGRSKYFKASDVGDCVVRAFAIASGRDYKEVYDLAKSVCKKGESPRNGLKKAQCNKLGAMLGGKWVTCMTIGSGCKVHLNADELPKGRIVCSCSKHLVAMIDGVVNDTYDSTREGNRCVYGYWVFN